MLDQDTFLTTLYVMIDDFCRQHLAPEPTRTGPSTALCRSEVLTLALFGQWARFRSERDFWRFATAQLAHLFPHLPHLSQFNRLERLHQETLLALSHHALSHHLEDRMDGQNC